MVRYRTALVTGASSGLGEALARELAARGSDLVLVARRAAVLEQLARELTGRHGVRVDVLPADVTDPADLARVEDRLRAGVDLLVNNAGIGTSGLLVTVDAAVHDAQVRTNVLAVVRLSRAALPGMLARRHGGVLHVSSVLSFLPLPGVATYAASKAFVTSFGASLAEEVRGSGVTVTTLCPGFVRTSLLTSERLPMLLEPATVARVALDAVERGRGRVVPGLRWKAGSVLARHVPAPVMHSVSRRLRRT